MAKGVSPPRPSPDPDLEIATILCAAAHKARELGTSGSVGGGRLGFSSGPAPIPNLKRHWKELTLFLRVPGVPLDSNAVERALKKAILHRKASLFYKTANGAGWETCT